jgi:hypothetical protein
MTFGDLRVLRREVNDSQGNTRWACECACGRVIVTRGTRLSYGSTKSCGCSRRSYNLNTAYFSEPTIRNSYWAGFIAADGCLTRKGALRIALSIKDREHLEKLKSELNFSGPIRDGLTTTPGGREVAYSCLIVWSKDMPHVSLALYVAFGVVGFELLAISFIRYFDMSFLMSALQVILGGALVFASGILIGNA